MKMQICKCKLIQEDETNDKTSYLQLKRKINCTIDLENELLKDEEKCINILLSTHIFLC